MRYRPGQTRASSRNPQPHPSLGGLGVGGPAPGCLCFLLSSREAHSYSTTQEQWGHELGPTHLSEGKQVPNLSWGNWRARSGGPLSLVLPPPPTHTHPASVPTVLALRPEPLPALSAGLTLWLPDLPRHDPLSLPRWAAGLYTPPSWPLPERTNPTCDFVRSPGLPLSLLNVLGV